jgi:HdeA/HdeB family
MKPGTKVAVGTAFVCGLVLATAHGPAKSQTIIEMSALKCGDYLESPPERQEQFAAWMSGYFNAERNMPMVDFRQQEESREVLQEQQEGQSDERHTQGGVLELGEGIPAV